jgi:hypothetical protein
MNRSIIALSAALSVAGCTGKDHLPSWDDVESGHPKGATNPPTPYLIVTPDMKCYKAWRPGMLPPTPANSDQVRECPVPEDCGTPIECPDHARDVWAGAIGKP